MPTYTYTLCTPDAASPMNQTQPLILDNFRAINEFVDMNHVGFNSTDFGKHNQTLMPAKLTDPTAQNNIANVYTKVTGTTNPAEIFLQYPTGTVEQLSGSTSSSSTTTVTYGDSWMQFPSGVIMKWGTFNAYDALSTAGFYFPVSDDIPAFKYAVVYGKITPIVDPASSFLPGNAWAFNPTGYFFYNYILCYVSGPTDLEVNYFCIGM